MRHQSQRGIGLIEIIIGSAIIIVGILGLSTAYSTFVSYAFSNENNVQAAYLTEEAFEAILFMRDSGWNANIRGFSTTTTYYLTWSSNRWATTTTPQYVDGKFLRSFTITDVKRDGSDNIATTGTYDPNTKKISVTIAYYQGHATTTKTLASYMTNLYAN